MQKVIITADDYGMCNEVDYAIDEGIKNGFITTTNVMVNMESLDNARTLRCRFPNISVGIHFNVTTGRPISKVENIPSLVDSNGFFYPINEFKKRYSKKLIKRTELTEELEAQYRLFESVCGHPDYWNTHENSSLHTKAFNAFSEVAKRHDVVATRTFQRVYFDKKGLALKQELREFAVRNFFELWFTHIRKDFKMPSARVVSFDKISKTEGSVLLDALKKDGRDLIEVVFHPAISDKNPLFGNISAERIKEYEFVASKQVYNKYVSENFEFVNFNEL